jgi:hypothetical protein
MYFDLFPNVGSNSSNVEVIEKRLLFKLLTVLFSVIYDVNENFGVVSKEDVKSGKFLDTPLINYDEINIITALKAASKYINILSADKIENPIIPKEIIEESLKTYKETYDYFLNLEYKNNKELHSIFVNNLKFKMNECAKNEEYEKAAEYRDKIIEVNNDLNF